MSSSPEDTKEQHNAVAVPNENKWSDKLKKHFRETFGTIFVKPVGKPPSLWGQLTMLNNRQRLTFLAGMLQIHYDAGIHALTSSLHLLKLSWDGFAMHMTSFVSLYRLRILVRIK